MKPEQIHKIVSAQRSYFSSGATLPVGIRLDALRRLKAAIVRHEADIARALYQDLGKSSEESYLCEIGMVLDELTFMLRHTGTYAKEHRVRTPLAQFAARSYTKASPLGVVLIMSPWNYPFLLTLDPLIDAIAAGNTANRQTERLFSLHQCCDTDHFVRMLCPAVRRCRDRRQRGKPASIRRSL